MVVNTSRFGQFEVTEEDLVNFPMGLLGFEQFKKYFLVDSNDDTCILWLQSVDHEDLAFPILEPEFFMSAYQVELSRNELESLKISKVGESKVFTILTIPSSIVDMTANIKAPIVINPKEKIGRQCVLQNNKYDVRHPMFSEFKARLSNTANPQASVVNKQETPKPVLRKDADLDARPDLKREPGLQV